MRKISISNYLSALIFFSGISFANDAVLNIADQNDELKTLFNSSDIVQSVSEKYQFINFVGGPAILEAFRANALDVGLVGNTPPIQAQVAKVSLPIIAARESASPAYRLAVRPGLNIKSFAELKGKKIGYAEGTARQPFILQALELGGLKPSEVTLVPLRPADFPTALQFSQVDVAPLTIQQFGRYIKAQPHTKDAFPEELYQDLPKVVNYLYASKKSLDDPVKNKAIRQFVQQWVTSTHWIKSNKEKWVDDYYIKSQGLDKNIAELSYKERANTWFLPLEKYFTEQQKTADTLYSAGNVPSRINVREGFYLPFNRVAADVDSTR